MRQSSRHSIVFRATSYVKDFLNFAKKISVVDPDPVGSEPLAGFGSGKNQSGYGQQIKIMDNFSSKTLNLKIQISFYRKQISPKSLFLVIICNLTHLQDSTYTKVKFTLRIFKKNHVGSETGSGSGYGSETNWKVGNKLLDLDLSLHVSNSSIHLVT